MFAQKMIATMAVVFTATALQIQTGAELGCNTECTETVDCFCPGYTCDHTGGDGFIGTCVPPPPPPCAAQGEDCDS